MNIDNLKFDERGLIPAIVQDASTDRVLMMAYMNRQSIEKTLSEGRVCFFSRSRRQLWIKGETSGNYLYFQNMLADCDNDCLLIKAMPTGPVCHTGTDTCWGEGNTPQNAAAPGDIGFLSYLEGYLRSRRQDPPEESYTARLISKGINKIAQKVGEEAVELVIEAKDDNPALFLNETADLLYHLIVLLIAKGHTLSEVTSILQDRHRK